jgi:ATP-dependent DNA helicase Rep
MTLNPAQQRAVDHVDGPLLVLAGAGSGKTRVITHKIARLVADGRFAAHQIAAVTFTNKAAREMRDRVAGLVSAEAAAALRVSTFHTLGLNILRREYAHLGYRRNFTIMDAADSRKLLQDVLRRERADTEEAVAGCLAAISRWKSELVDPETAESRAGDAMEAARSRQYGAYQEALRSYNALDFDDLIFQPVRLLRSSESVRESWRGRIRYLLGDEYQDTNLAQYELMRLIVGDRGCFTVVGDDDQSIYAWRGARPDNLQALSRDYPGLTVIPLEQNYRSSRRILSAANAVIANNPHLFEKRLWSDLGPGDPLRVLPTRDGRDEAERVAMDLQRLAAGRSVRWGDVAILYRSNHQSRPFEQALRERDIPYRVTGGPSFFERAEIRDLMAYMRLITNPDDDAAFLRVVNVPRREIGATTVGRLAAYAGSRSQSLLAACLEAGLHGALPPQAVGRLQGFARWVVTASDRMNRGEAVTEFVESLIGELNYRDWLRDSARDPRQADRCLENVDELIRWLRALARREMARSLPELLAHLSLMDMLDRQEGEQDSDAVTLMTLHAAKGLEFPHVYLAGMEEDLLPHRNSQDESGLEEERRLAYVGITRAMRSLVLSYARKRSRFGEVVRCEPSRFLYELPEDGLIWDGRKSGLSDEERRARGRETLDGLRRLLSES